VDFFPPSGAKQSNQTNAVPHGLAQKTHPIWQPLTFELALPEQFLTFHLDVVGSRSKRSNCASDDEADARRQKSSARSQSNGQRKINAAFEATASLVAGASGDEIVHRYRQHVIAKNAKRLSGKKPGVQANATPTEISIPRCGHKPSSMDGFEVIWKIVSQVELPALAVWNVKLHSLLSSRMTARCGGPNPSCGVSYEQT
jgi:hypothetical protein